MGGTGVCLCAVQITIILWRVTVERLEAFEKMLDDLKVQAAYEENQMEQLKAAVSRCPRNIHVGHQELAAWVEGLGL